MGRAIVNKSSMGMKTGGPADSYLKKGGTAKMKKGGNSKMSHGGMKKGGTKKGM